MNHSLPPPPELHLPPNKTLRLANAAHWVRPPRDLPDAARFSDLPNALYAWDNDTLPTCPNCGTRTHWAELIGNRHYRNVLLNKCPNTHCNMAFLSCDW